MRYPVFAGLLLLFTACASISQPDPTGDWLGTMEAPGASLRVEFQIRSSEDGYSASGISHDQGGQPFPAESVVLDGQSISINFPIIDAVYRGQVLGDRMEGMFTQMGFEIPFNLERQ